MKVAIVPALSDINLDIRQHSSQRQLTLAISALADMQEQNWGRVAATGSWLEGLP